eukprot:3447546-Prymnesium_polylepis.1
MVARDTYVTLSLPKASSVLQDPRSKAVLIAQRVSRRRLPNRLRAQWLGVWLTRLRCRGSRRWSNAGGGWR